MPGRDPSRLKGFGITAQLPMLKANTDARRRRMPGVDEASLARGQRRAFGFAEDKLVAALHKGR